MSTYYELVCDKHKMKCNAASRTFSGCCHLIDSDVVLPHFIVAHSLCEVRIVSEHEELPEDYTMVAQKPDHDEMSIEDMKNKILEDE